MWLSHRLYEAVPGICFTFAAILLAGSLYVGFPAPLAFLCLAAAVGCSIYGAGTMMLRRRYRRPRATPKVEDPGEILQAMARRFH